MKLAQGALSRGESLSFAGLHPSVVAREATVEDLKDIRELFFKIFAEPAFNDPDKGFGLLKTMQARYRTDPEKHEREFFGRDRNRRFALVVHDRRTGRLVGTAWLIANLDYDPRFDEGEINKIYLLPECRGLGVGLWLMRQMISKAQNLGFRRLSLITGPERIQALALYQRLGFKPTLQVRYTDSQTCFSMTRALSQNEGDSE